MKTIPWDTFFKVETDRRITLQLTPDPTVHSGRQVESILNTFHSMHEQFLDRIWYNKYQLVYKSPDFVSYRVVFEANRITFYLVIPASYKKAIVNSINSCWPKVAVVEADSGVSRLDAKNTVCAYLELRDHFFKSTLVDRTQNAPLPSLVAAGRNVADGDLAVVDVAFIPVSRRWQAQAKQARNKARKGHETRRKPTTILEFLYIIGDFLSDSVIEKILDFVDLMVGHEGDKKESMLLLPSKFATPTEQKSEYPGFDTVIRVVSKSEQRTRSELTLNAISTAFKDLTLDNEFDVRRARPSLFISRLKNDKPPLLRINGNILSVPECSQIFQLPSSALQEEYPEIECIPILEVEADPKLLKGGVQLGEVTFKRQSTPIFQPIDARDEKTWDEGCLPHVIVGGMGQGKTKGFLSNYMVEAYLKGFGCLAIDAAKREIGDQIQYAVDVGLIPKEDFVRINLGEQPMSLDWREATFHPKGKSRLASTIIDFFDITEDTTGQTGRFLRAMVLSMKSGKMSEILDILEDEKRMDEAIKDLPEGLAKKTMQQYRGSSPAQRRQYASPIYNRLDLILGDEHLAECMDSDYELNLIDIMSQRKIFVFDLPDDELIGLQTDILVNLLCAKIDLAMRMRAKVYGPKAEFPFFVLMDEPHKYLRSAKIWESAAVESRKWRIGNIWSFHYWEQIPSGLQKAIKNALPHYHLYPTSKLTWKSLEEEIKPFTVEQALKIKKWHALNIIRAGDGYLPPVLAKMMEPPTERLKNFVIHV